MKNGVWNENLRRLIYYVLNTLEEDGFRNNDILLHLLGLVGNEQSPLMIYALRAISINSIQGVRFDA